MSGTADTVSLRVTLRYASLDEFVDRHAEHVSSAGLFVRTKAPKPPGTRIRFQLLLTDGTTALEGEGVVVSVRSDERPGMALRFNELAEPSQQVVERVVQAHGDGALAPTPLSLRFGTTPSGDVPAFSGTGNLGSGSLGTGSLGTGSLGPGSFSPVGSGTGGLGAGWGASGQFSDLSSSSSWVAPELPSLEAPPRDATERIDLNRLRSMPPAQPVPPPPEAKGPRFLPQEPMDEGPSQSIGVHSDDPLPPPPRIPDSLRKHGVDDSLPDVPGPPTVRTPPPAPNSMDRSEMDAEDGQTDPHTETAPEQTEVVRAHESPQNTDVPAVWDPREATASDWEASIPSSAPQPAAWVEPVAEPQDDFASGTPTPAESDPESPSAAVAAESRAPGREEEVDEPEEVLSAPVEEPLETEGQVSSWPTPAGASADEPAPESTDENGGSPDNPWTESSPSSEASFGPEFEVTMASDGPEPHGAQAVLDSHPDGDREAAPEEEDAGPAPVPSPTDPGSGRPPSQAEATEQVSAHDSGLSLTEEEEPARTTVSPAPAATPELPPFPSGLGPALHGPEETVSSDPEGFGSATLDVLQEPPMDASLVDEISVDERGPPSPLHPGILASSSNRSSDETSPPDDGQGATQIAAVPMPEKTGTFGEDAFTPVDARDDSKRDGPRLEFTPEESVPSELPAVQQAAKEEEPPAEPTRVDFGPEEETRTEARGLGYPERPSSVQVQGVASFEGIEDTAPVRGAPDRTAPPRSRNVVERSRDELEVDRPQAWASPGFQVAESSAPSADIPAGAARAVGVEFGVRWIRVGLFERKEFRVINPTSGHPLPGLVYVRQDGSLETGARARTIAENEPDRCVSVMELLMAVQDGRVVRPHLPLLSWGPEGGLVQLKDHRFEIYELVLALTEATKQVIDREMDGDSYRVFLGLPPGLDTLCANLVRNACKEVGLQLAHTPTMTEAHVAAFHLEDEPVDTALVVHVDELSVGVGVLRRGPQGLKTVYERRVDDVSARAIDEAVVDLTLRSLLQQAGEDHRSDPAARIRVREAFALARQDMRRTPTVELKVSLAAPGGASKVTLDRSIQLARSRIYGIGEGIVNQLHDHLTAALEDVGVGPRSLGMVLLSGEGASYPPFGQMLAQLTGREPSMLMPPILAHVQGLARWGRAHEQRTIAQRPDTLDASVGIELPGQRFRPLMAAGTRLPAELKRFQPIRDGQTEMELRLYQGEGETIRGCEPLGFLALRGLRKAPSRRVEIYMKVDTEGLLTVTLSEPSSGISDRQVFTTRQTPPERRRSIPAPTPPSAPPTDDAKGGLLGRLFGKRPQ